MSGCKFGISSELIENSDPGQGVPLVVGATNCRSGISSKQLPLNHMASFSNYGIGTNVSAHRKNIPLRYWKNGTPNTIYENTTYTTWKNGTSFSCPITSGLVALFAQTGESPIEVRQKILDIANQNSVPNLVMSNKDELTLKNLSPSRYSFTYDKDLNVATFNLNLTEEDDFDIFLKVIDSSSFIPNKNKVNYRKIQIGDILQIEFTDESDSQYSNWWKVIEVNYSELKLKLDDEFHVQTESGSPTGYIKNILSLTNTHEETDGIIRWQSKTDPKINWNNYTSHSRLKQRNILTGHTTTLDQLKLIETTNPISIFNPFQNYDLKFNGVVNTNQLETERIILDYESEHRSKINAKLVTRYYEEEVLPTSISVKNGELPTGWKLNLDGQFELNQENIDATQQNNFSRTIEVKFSNGYESYEIVRNFEVFISNPPEIPADDYIRNDKNIAIFGSCEEYNNEQHNLIDYRNQLKSVYSQFKDDPLNSSVLSWSSEIHPSIPQPIQKFIPGKLYYIEKKSNINEVKIKGIRSQCDQSREISVVKVNSVDSMQNCENPGIVENSQVNNQFEFIWWGVNKDSFSSESDYEKYSVFNLRDDENILEVFKLSDKDQSNFNGYYNISDLENSNISSLEFGNGYLIKFRNKDSGEFEFPIIWN